MEYLPYFTLARWTMPVWAHSVSLGCHISPSYEPSEPHCRREINRPLALPALAGGESCPTICKKLPMKSHSLKKTICLEIYWTSVVLTCHTFENNFGWSKIIQNIWRRVVEIFFRYCFHRNYQQKSLAVLVAIGMIGSNWLLEYFQPLGIFGQIVSFNRYAGEQVLLCLHTF